MAAERCCGRVAASHLFHTFLFGFLLVLGVEDAAAVPRGQLSERDEAVPPCRGCRSSIPANETGHRGEAWWGGAVL